MGHFPISSSLVRLHDDDNDDDDDDDDDAHARAIANRTALQREPSLAR